MNKRYFTALIATFLMAVSAIAQTNTYNMVLTLTDGTVITIGPNDLKQLDFKEGDVTVSGTNITDLMNSIKDMQASLAAVQKEVAITQMSVDDAKAELQADISALAASVVSSQKQIDALNASIKESQTSIDALNNSVASSQIQIKDLQDNMSALQKDIANNKAELMKYTNDAVAANKAELQESINMLLAEIAKNKEVITNEYHKAIDDLQTTIRQNTANIETNTADIAGNKANIETNTADIAGNKANIETNAAGIDKNKDAIIELVKKLRDAGIRI